MAGVRYIGNVCGGVKSTLSIWQNEIIIAAISDILKKKGENL